MTVGPLVSCCMPTKNPPEMVERAIRSFVAQTYPQRELVVVGTHDHLGELGAKLFEDLLDYAEVCVPAGLSIGELRNIACRRANGSIIAHWDDDDWSHPKRLEEQVEILTKHFTQSVTGYQGYYAIDEEKREAWLFDGRHLDIGKRRWVAGGTLAYLRGPWENDNFETSLAYGEDESWEPSYSAHVLAGPNVYVARLHPGNTSPKAPGTLGWTRVDYDMVARFMEEK